jgi:hypothetical protein
MSYLLNPFKPIIKSDVNIYVEAFGDDDYETRYNKTLIINKVKSDREQLKRENFNNYRDYETMLREKYEAYKQSLAIVGSIGDEGGSNGRRRLPTWFKNAVTYGGEYVTYDGQIVQYGG